jgi:hypothetical protein
MFGQCRRNCSARSHCQFICAPDAREIGPKRCTIGTAASGRSEQPRIPIASRPWWRGRMHASRQPASPTTPRWNEEGDAVPSITNEALVHSAGSMPLLGGSRSIALGCSKWASLTRDLSSDFSVMRPSHIGGVKLKADQLPSLAVWAISVRRWEVSMTMMYTRASTYAAVSRRSYGCIVSHPIKRSEDRAIPACVALRGRRLWRNAHNIW